MTDAALTPRRAGLSVERRRLHEQLARAGSGAVVLLVAAGVALLLAAVVLIVDGRSPVDAVIAIWSGSLADPRKLGVTLNRAVPFALAGLGFVVAQRAGMLNIGAEGQIFVGAAASGAAALVIGDRLPQVLGVPVALVCGAAAGALISMVAALLFLWRRVPVVLSTLLLNFVAIQLVSMLVRTPWLLQEGGRASGSGSDPSGLDGVARSFPQSDQIVESMRLPRWVAGNQLHLGVALAAVALIVVVVLLGRTVIGFRIRVLGASPDAARLAGVPVGSTIAVAMAICGALGGVAGAVIVMGDRFRVLEAVSDNYGFIAILAALLAGCSPVGTVVAAICFAALQRGGQVMEASGVAPSSTVLIVQGLVVVLIAGGVEWRRRRRIAGAARAALGLGGS